MSGDPLGDITDALARGRLTVAEVAAISPDELEALFELGAMRIETGRDAEAVRIFAGLVSLFAYEAKYWRAYGIGLHRLLELNRARAAYDAALLLEPDHPETLCYRGEVRLYLGDIEGAVADLGAAIGSGRGDLTRRAESLLECVGAVAPFSGDLPEEPPRPRLLDEEDTFTLGDGRTLPLGDGVFADDEPTAPNAVPEPLPEEITNTARTYVPEVADLFEPAALDGEATDPLGRTLDPRSDTGTVTQPLREVTGSLRPLREVTNLWPPEPRVITETALVPERPRAIALGLESRRQAVERIWSRPRAPTSAVPSRSHTVADQTSSTGDVDWRPPPRERTQTAVVRRRLQQPLCLDEEQTEETVIHTPAPDDPEATQS